MERYKTAEGMFSSAFAEMGEVDDNGKPITATENPISDYEYERRRKEKIQRFKKRIKKQGAGEVSKNG